MSLPRLLCACLVAVLVSALPASGQGAPAAAMADDLPRVFLDCQANGCDGDFLRTELTWLNFVRDRTLARVHILATSQGTASGGTELTVAFIGLGADSARVDTIVQFSPQGDTQAERRNVVRRVIAQGMLRFVANTPLSSRLNVTYQAPAPGLAVAATRGARDPWNLWVFRISGGSFFNGEEQYKYYNMNGSVRASRITPASKLEFNVNANRNQDRYTLPDGEVLITNRRNANASALLARSLNEHWSAGLQLNASSSISSNLDLGWRAGPALEFDVFPYSESTRRQLIVRYSVGVKSLKYDSLTVYDKLRETKPDHRLILASTATQPWGNVFGSVTASQYLDSPRQYRLDGFAGVSWRIIRGLNLNFEMGYTKLRDQLNLKRGTASEEEILLRLRQLATGYYYFGNVGISYTFGSVFQNVVNPRFTQNTGNFFF